MKSNTPSFTLGKAETVIYFLTFKITSKPIGRWKKYLLYYNDIFLI